MIVTQYSLLGQHVQASTYCTNYNHKYGTRKDGKKIAKLPAFEKKIEKTTLTKSHIRLRDLDTADRHSKPLTTCRCSWRETRDDSQASAPIRPLSNLQGTQRTPVHASEL
jgi:hypothetical protein